MGWEWGDNNSAENFGGKFSTEGSKESWKGYTGLLSL
jgi:hypothetical protein